MSSSTELSETESILTGGCLCGEVRFVVEGDPAFTTYCHCKYCQRTTGSAYVVKPSYSADQVKLTQGTPMQYDHVSTRSGNTLTTHFCSRCGTNVFMTTQRNPSACGVFAGTFDNPESFNRVTNARHIFVDSSLPGTAIPPGTPIYRQHVDELDGTAAKPAIYPHAYITRKKNASG